MTRIVVESRIDNAGVLQLTLPVGPEHADETVRVTVESVLTVQEWRQRILDTAGKWAGECEHPTPEPYEQRESLS